MSFNLIDQPWIRVRYQDGSVTEVSLSTLFQDAEQIIQITGELPSQDFAVLRLLLAILYRSFDSEFTEDDWKAWWQEGLPLDEIGRYLKQVEDRFDLLHPKTPFFQVPDLQTAKGENKDVSLLVFDVPPNKRLFSMRAGSGLERLSFAEATRWIVHTQAFDYSGIKSGAVGDSRVKGGKGYPIGVGAAGRLGGVSIEGKNLRETLLLNLVKPAERDDDFGDDDLPPWEKPHLGPAEESEGRKPTGPVDLYTWQSRRIRLFHDETGVIRCLVSNGDKLETPDLFTKENLTAWRRNPTFEKSLGRAQVFTPVQHNPARLFWRGISALLPKKTPPAALAKAGRETFLPAVIEWLYKVQDELPRDAYVSLRASGVLYPDSQNSTVGEIFDDRLLVSLALLSQQDGELGTLAENAVVQAEGAVQALKNLAKDLVVAAGGDGDGQRQRSDETGYAALDRPYRRWLSGLDLNTDIEEARKTWRTECRRIVVGLANELLDTAGPAAWKGRERDGYLINSSLAERKFYQQIARVFGQQNSGTEDEGPHGSGGNDDE
ncbi:type I-E CRISPR-associated protein Cse1/CasA [Psychromicrobium sp. YIM B11713]|uniref:type I-E CRISPR-associated protein Cse1/CasA n=1 Tax=Psychromicrobium sp. YIM B11713 TaxID=3145233 RepID=UPI00374F39E9